MWDTLISGVAATLVVMAAIFVMGYFEGRGLPIVYHSDGDIRKVIPLLIDAGVRCIQPLESKANMDLLELKREYGDRLVLMGGVDFERIALGPIDHIIGWCDQGGDVLADPTWVESNGTKWF